MTCKLCNLDKVLQNSHIIPEFLYKPLYDEIHRAQLLGIDWLQQGFRRLKPLQNGLKEKLLCYDCEQLLNNRYEKYFHNQWINKKALPSELDTEHSIKLSDLDYGKFKLFHLSVLFRAGVSTLPQFEQVKLGPHEAFLREMILNNSPGSDKKYPVMCHAITTSNNEIQYGLITNPFKQRQPSGHISYGFCFGGCVWYYIVDSHEVASFSDFMLTSKGELGIMAMPWETFLNL